jgi:hypothetical protein
MDILCEFRLRHSDLTAKGKGNKSAIAGAIDSQFYKRGWLERQFITAIKVDEDISETPTHDIDCFRANWINAESDRGFRICGLSDSLPGGDLGRC